MSVMASFFTPAALVPAGATLAGVVVGGAITYVTAWRQGVRDSRARRNEWRFQQITAATLALRLAGVQAGRLNYERSIRYTIRSQILSLPFGPLLPWREPSPCPFMIAIMEAMNAVGVIRDEVPDRLFDGIRDASMALLEGPSSPHRLEAYWKASRALVDHLEPKTRALVK